MMWYWRGLLKKKKKEREREIGNGGDRWNEAEEGNKERNGGGIGYSLGKLD